MAGEEFKVLEVYGTTNGCRVELKNIPDDIEYVLIGDLQALHQEIGQMLKRFALAAQDHNALVRKLRPSRREGESC